MTKDVFFGIVTDLDYFYLKIKNELGIK